VGRGSRGRRSETDEGSPERMEISYTVDYSAFSVLAVFVHAQIAYQNYKPTQQEPILPVESSCVIMPPYTEGKPMVRRYQGSLAMIVLDDEATMIEPRQTLQ